MKFFLLVGTFSSLFLVTASGQDTVRVSDAWKTTFKSDPDFVQLRILFDSLMVGLAADKYDKSLNASDTLLLEPTQEPSQKEFRHLVNQIVHLREVVEQKYPILTQCSKEATLQIYLDCGLFLNHPKIATKLRSQLKKVESSGSPAKK